MTAIGYVLVKGTAMSVVTLAIIHSSLAPFVQALIIAIVSAIIGAFGLIVQALINAAANERLARQQAELIQHVEDVKASVGADKRRDDHVSHKRH